MLHEIFAAKATRCENVTQYYQTADTMIGCLHFRDCYCKAIRVVFDFTISLEESHNYYYVRYEKYLI